MPILTLWKFCFFMERYLCMAETLKTFQLHSKFFKKEHVYFTNQHNKMTLVSCNRTENQY